MRLKDRKIIVTGGPTREWLDPVRYISNASSGKMGAAIADAASRLSAQTVFIHGPVDTSIICGKKYKTRRVETAAEMQAAIFDELVPESVIIMAAAPLDFRPKEKSAHKIKKANNIDEFDFIFIKNQDILRNISGKRRNDKSLTGIFIAGFAAETQNFEANAVEKLRKKGIDMICLNDVSKNDRGLDSDNNQIIIFTKNGQRIELPLMPKSDVADRILDAIGRELSE